MRPRRAVEAAATPGSRGPEQEVWSGMGVRSSWLPRRRTCAKQAIGLHEGIGQSTFGIIANFWGSLESCVEL